MKLSIVIGTHNRLEQLKRCIQSILTETRSPIKVYITDAGSTDGTIEYLQSIASETLVPVLVGQKIGQARAYNEVFNQVESPYVAWLSDDNVVVNGQLDTAVAILEKNSTIGMVALKVKDVRGPFVDAPYIGGISSIGILNANQGVLPTPVLKKLGGFDEQFRDYGIDPDLTTRLLFAGYKVVYTKKIALLHYRNWEKNTKSKEYHLMMQKQQQYCALYDQKYLPYNAIASNWLSLLHPNRFCKRALTWQKILRFPTHKKWTRDLYNLINAKYIHILDPLFTLGKAYYLVQTLTHSEKKQAERIQKKMTPPETTVK